MAAPEPKKETGKIDYIKSRLLRPALTSNYQCWFDPPQDVVNYLKANKNLNYNGFNQELISLSCSEAALPGSSLMTNEINDDYTGITERLAYRRQYDDRADFTFYVDHDNQNGYKVIWFFEQWMQYIANEQNAFGLDDPNFNYRFRFPDSNEKGSGTGYRSQGIYINKFERDFKGYYLSYKLFKAYPVAINSIPVSYESSDLLKCTVSFTYTRYIVNRSLYTFEQTLATAANNLQGAGALATPINGFNTGGVPTLSYKASGNTVNPSTGLNDVSTSLTSSSPIV